MSLQDPEAAGFRLSSTIEPLILDLLRWLRDGPRPYDEVMEAWRTSCPRLTVWEDAMAAGRIARRRVGGEAPVVEITPEGLKRLKARASKIRRG